MCNYVPNRVNCYNLQMQKECVFPLFADFRIRLNVVQCHKITDIMDMIERWIS